MQPLATTQPADSWDELGQLLDDICIPRARLADFYIWLDERRQRTDLLLGSVAHAGDGNVHPTVAFDTGDPAQVDEAQSIFEEIMDMGLSLGGTISGEHGIGSLKSAWIAKELHPGSRLLRRTIKDSIGPRGVLNPH